MNSGFEEDLARIARISSVPAILEVITETTGMRFAAIARVTDTHWVALAVRDLIDFGLKPGGELVLDSTICNEIRQHRKPVVLGHASRHAVFADHHTLRQYGLESYISVPIIRRSGEFFGTLCAIDPLPADIERDTILKTFTLFAELISSQLDIEERLVRADSALADARAVAELREQFIAVLGHDLRNPLSAIASVNEYLLCEPQSETATRYLKLVRGSVQRMSDLIDDVLDFARGRLGTGLSIHRSADVMLKPVLEQIVSELRSSHPDRAIESAIDIAAPVDCDATRIGQMVSNLLANALTHGAPATPVRLVATADQSELSIAVANAGPAIPPAVMERLFQPFFRAEAIGSAQGLGLGLFIVSEIARAHGATLTVSSTDAETRFVVRMPI